MKRGMKGVLHVDYNYGIVEQQHIVIRFRMKFQFQCQTGLNHLLTCLF